MAFVRQQGVLPQPEQLAPLPRPLPAQPRIQSKITQLIDAGAHIDVVSTGSIDSQAGVRSGLPRRHTNLAHYAAVSMRLSGQRYVPMRRARGGKLERKQDDEEEAAFLEAVEDAVALLAEDSGRSTRSELEAQLERYFEPVQRLKILVRAMQDVEHGDMPARQKASVARSLNAMVSTLMKKHPHEIRAVLQETEEAGATVDPLSEKLQSSVRLRMLIGAKDMGKFDTPLSPLTILKALIRNFGPDCLLAMRSLRSRMMSGL